MIPIKKQWLGGAELLVAAMVWGMAFVAQSSATEHMGAFTFNASRMLLTFVILLGALFITRGRRTEYDVPLIKYIKLGGVLGFLLFASLYLQQLGLKYTTAGKSGFITALYIVLVPIIGLFMGNKIGVFKWVSVLITLFGMFLLCITDELTIGKGDLLTLGCAIICAFHIIFISMYAGRMDPIKLCCVQFAFAGGLSLISALLFEQPALSQIRAAWVAIAYVGILSGALGYTLQLMGQKHTEPAVASLIMCLESVFAALGGYLVLHELLSTRELIGCGLTLAGCLLSQLPVEQLARGKKVGSGA